MVLCFGQSQQNLYEDNNMELVSDCLSFRDLFLYKTIKM